MMPIRFRRTAPAADRPRGRPPVVLPGALLTFALAVSLAAGIPERTLAVRVWLVLIGAVAVRVLVAMVRERPLSPRTDAFDTVAAPRRPDPPAIAPGLKESARLVKWASGTAADLHFRVRPVVREVAAQRLASGHGLDLDAASDAAAAEAACGPVLWELVRPGRAMPDDRTGPALEPAVVADVIQTLESL